MFFILWLSDSEKFEKHWAGETGGTLNNLRDKQPDQSTKSPWNV